jgi:hypothetical protein
MIHLVPMHHGLHVLEECHTAVVTVAVVVGQGPVQVVQGVLLL